MNAIFLNMNPIFPNKRVILASGYFDPLHVGHIQYLKEAKQLGDILIVIVNNDFQAALKKGKAFMPELDRWNIVSELRCVDIPILSVDSGPSVCETIEMLVQHGFNPMIFAKGGDRYSTEIPEKAICDKYGIKIVDGLGAKIRSSSEFIQNANK